MLSTVSPLSVSRSSLEEMLESIKRRDELPKDIIPALPVRPISKARLPSARRSLPVGFKIGDSVTPSDTVTPKYLITSLKEKEGKKRDRHLNKEINDLGYESDGDFGSNKISKVKVVPLDESPSCVIKEECGRNDDSVLNSMSSTSPLVSDESTSGGNVNCVLNKEIQVWCQLSNNQWKSGKIESASIEDCLVMLTDGSVVTVPRGNILPANPDYLDGSDDLIRLSFLNEPSVLHNLQTRYCNDQIYTKAGRILVAINPFNDVHLHENEFRTWKKLMDPLVHATAEFTFNEMMRGEENQSIILSGQSGAGKTKTASIVIEYLASLGGGNEMHHKVFQANLILESFGNAKTSMNHNTSRFGKLIEIHFNSTGEICGAQIETLLLEKSRVAHLSKGERSFHIFYQLCSGAPSDLKGGYCICITS
ncbi:Myosin-2 [Thalictrum thalictroides]|uniref:Myosin-2 n=1 Tax=Thalictrum thalictroides TaxID=46969 RepID=A0A7J6VYA7_THATH|nr:Myosin-2 [Thalictrum thalictroides]